MTERRASLPTDWSYSQTEEQQRKDCLTSSARLPFIISPCARNASLWEAGEETETATLARAHTFLPGLAESYLARQELPITTELAVLFVDIADSTRTLFRQPPAQALAVLQHFTKLVTEIALAHCGDVKDYEGDGALLYFTSVAQATRAALAMRTALTVQQKSQEPLLQARFSLNVGEATIGVIGSALRRSVALIGPAVNLASRLLKHVSPGGIITPQAVVERLQQEAPALARDFQLQGACMIVRGFEEQCVTAYHIPPETGATSDSHGAGTRRCGGTVAIACEQKPQPEFVERKTRSATKSATTTITAAAFPSLSPLPAHKVTRTHTASLPIARPLNTFRREGEYWTLTFEGHTCRIKHICGLQHLARLLQHPHHQFSALALAADASPSVEQTIDTSELTKRGASDAGDLLDPQAKTAYHQRLRELRTELEEARRFHDLGRVEKLQQELHFLTHELSSAIGLGGRHRKAASTGERARLSVTRAIRRTIKKITLSHPPLGKYLSLTIHTGAQCAYHPRSDQLTPWQF